MDLYSPLILRNSSAKIAPTIIAIPVKESEIGTVNTSAKFEKLITPREEPRVPIVPLKPIPVPLFLASVASAIRLKTIGE